MAAAAAVAVVVIIAALDVAMHPPGRRVVPIARCEVNMPVHGRAAPHVLFTVSKIQRIYLPCWNLMRTTINRG